MEITITIKLDEQELLHLLGKEEKQEVEIEEEKSVYDQFSKYARFFDDACPQWDRDPKKNLIFLKCQQEYANELLKVKGYLFLNEVYGLLGIRQSKEGQTVGWIYDEKNPIGDNFVSFGLDKEHEIVRDFIMGFGNTVLLDFNVDGNILEYL